MQNPKNALCKTLYFLSNPCYNVYICQYMIKEKTFCMGEQIGVRDEISLSELFKILWRKALILILACVIGLIAGGAFGVLQTWNVEYYGTRVEFYVNPSKSEDASSETGSQYGVYGAYGKPLMESMVKLLESEDFAEKLMLDENGMPARDIPENTAEINAFIDAGDANGALEAWRKTKHYKKMIAFVSEATTYSYATDSDIEEELAKSFIFVEISVLNGEKDAQILLDCVKTHVPAYIKKNMVKPDGYDETNCQRISRLDEVKLLNPGELLSTAIKYAILLGAASFLAACVAVIVVDYSDKRLRNFERTMDQLGVPVLGVIPTITDPAPKAQTDKEVA